MSTHFDQLDEKKTADVQHFEGGVSEADAARAYRKEALLQEEREHDMGIIEAVKAYPMACFWAFVMAFTIVMESFDMFLIGNFVALPAFKQDFGIFVNNEWVIPTKWQTALSIGGQVGALAGVFISGPITSRFGYRWATIIGLVMMNATIFLSFFAHNLTLLLIGQLLEGVPWGFFIANSPAYASEVVPMPLRGVVTAYLQMCWAIGGILVGVVTYVYNTRLDQWAYRIPFAIQWIFPTPLLILVILMPESPWWLVRRGRHEQALKSVQRLGRQSRQNAPEVVAMMIRTVEIEAKMGKEPSYPDLFKGTNLRRTAIISLIYAGQNFAGNLIANQAVFFFQQAGIAESFSFALGLINSSLSVVGVATSWIFSAYFGRRTVYLVGTAVNVAFLTALGVAATVKQTSSSSFAQAVLGIIISTVFAATVGPIAYTIISETSSVRLRPLSTGFGRGMYYVAEIPCIFLASQMLNPTGWNLAGKCGYIWAGTGTICFIAAYFGLPELKHRSYREADILFNRHVSARKFKSTVIDAEDDE